MNFNGIGGNAEEIETVQARAVTLLQHNLGGVDGRTLYY